MLKVVRAVLDELKLTRPDSSLRYYINISKGDAISVGAFLDPHRFFQVKASEFVDVDHEYQAHVRGWNQYPDFVPRPLGYRVREGWTIMVTQGVHHTLFPFDDAMRGRNSTPNALADLYRYFEISGQRTMAQGEVESHQAFFNRLQTHFIHTPYAALASQWLEQGRSLGVESFALIAQHGDFVQNNLACSGNQLVIFDWEDFGDFHLPGLDICSLCFSVAPDAAAMRDLMCATPERERPIDVFVRRACGLCGIDVELFRRLVPLYLLVFLYSKHDYGQAGQDRIGTMLQRLSE